MRPEAFVVGATIGLLLAVAAPASAAFYDTPDQVVAAFRNGPVAVDARVKPPITDREQELLVRAIRRLDPGRIRIAYVRPQLATAAGGLTALTNMVSDRSGGLGVTLVEAGPDVYLVTTYLDDQRAVEAVRGAFTRTEKTEAPARQLLEVARVLAAVDPGEAAQSGDSQTSTVDAKGIVHAIEIFILVGAGVVLLLALTFVGGRGIRARRRRVAVDEALDDRRAAAKEALLALGGAIEELDIDTQMPNADADGKRHYGAALDAYTKGEDQLQKADSDGRLATAEQTIAAGRAEMDLARAKLRPG